MRICINSETSSNSNTFFIRHKTLTLFVWGLSGSLPATKLTFIYLVKFGGIFCHSGRFALWLCRTETTVPFPPPPPPPGRSSLFPIDDNLLDDGHGNQGVPGVLGSTNCYPHQNGERIERFSRKVFVGGLPPDIDEGQQKTQRLVLPAWSRAAVVSLSFHLFLPQMKSPQASAASATWWWTGLTKPRANPTFHPKVAAGFTSHPNQSTHCLHLYERIKRIVMLALRENNHSRTPSNCQQKSD